MAEDQNRTWVDRYMLRLPDGMRDRIKAAAEENNRSMNAEIVATLEDAYPTPVADQIMGDFYGHVVSLAERAERISHEIDKCLSEIASEKDEDKVLALSDRYRGLILIEKQVRNAMLGAVGKIKAGEGAGNGDG